MVTQQLVFLRGDPFRIGRADPVFYGTKINLNEVDLSQPVILNGGIRSFAAQARIAFDDDTVEIIESPSNAPVVQTSINIENRDISNLLVGKTGIAEVQIFGFTTTNGIPINFLGGTLTFEKIPIQPIIPPTEPPITEPRDDEPILIPIVPPVMEQTKVFGLTVKQIAVLIGLGVLIL